VRVIILSQWYVPEPDLKIHLIGKLLIEKGHSVTAITGFPNYPLGRIYPGYRQRPWAWELRDGVRVLRLPLFPDHSRSVLRRSLGYISFTVAAAVLGPILCGGADVMWVYSPPVTVGLSAWWIGLVRRIPFVFGIHDMWPETLAATGMVAKDGLIYRCMAWCARFVHQRAAAITVISPGFRTSLIGKGVPAEKIHVIPNWADDSVYQEVEPSGERARQYGLANRFNVLYGGNIGAAQALDSLLDAAALLRDLPEVQLVLIGDGMDAERLRALAGERGLKNVRFLGQQPYDDMPHFFALADALFLQLRRDPLFEITIPSKTLAYLAAGRPIICAAEGDVADVVREAGAGIVCPPEDAGAIAGAIRRLYAMPHESRRELGRAGRRTYHERFTPGSLIGEYERLLQESAAARGIRDWHASNGQTQP
jgi:colanic acid biosynthesis glycosyl transferase WcaI